MSDEQPWRPATLPSPLEAGIAARTDASGRLTLRSDSNMFWGHVVAWLLLAVAVGANNRSGLSGPDALTVGQAVLVAACLFVTSLAALMVFGRPHVTVADRWVTVRNPLRTYRMDISTLESLDEGFWGFPLLRLRGGRSLRVFGLGESSNESMQGGGDGAVILRSLISQEEAGTPAVQQESGHWSLMSGSLILLLLGWLAYVLAVTLL
ncbi:hypothetical protein GCM10022415_15980 [Knoellia locipacati]|uniref:Uncharacterized protein n=1 Tax=Knoellia locipacati TaxID=882824 RepID=A0A512SZZ2_9MICO|nr:hypothetical protein [Knoellia locipacati]GEQ13548.1 hypothetical protein KLO01_15950 [Knoellia locipacati]